MRMEWSLTAAVCALLLFTGVVGSSEGSNAPPLSAQVKTLQDKFEPYGPKYEPCNNGVPSLDHADQSDTSAPGDHKDCRAPPDSSVRADLKAYPAPTD